MPNKLIAAAEELNWKDYRLRQVRHAREIALAGSWEEISTLPKNDREWLKKNLAFDSLSLLKRQVSADGSAQKFLLGTEDGKSLETVLLLHSGQKREWGTVCLSSQIGCPVKCSFCATGQMSFARNLSTEEILDQFLIAKREAKKKNLERLNLVFMGMGEPLLNLDNVLAAIRILIDHQRYALSPTRITVSTSGILPGLERLFATDINLGLALSLHAPDDQLRTQLMSINQKYPLADIMGHLQKWEKRGTEVLYEYVLIADVNDALEDAEKLAALLRGRHAKLNLIPLNQSRKSEFRRPVRSHMQDFLVVLLKAGIQTTLRHTKGDDIQAACGQLKGEG